MHKTSVLDLDIQMLGEKLTSASFFAEIIAIQASKALN